MSKNNNYQKYYNQHKGDETVNEPIKPQPEEVSVKEDPTESQVSTVEEIAPKEETAEKGHGYPVIVVNANLVNFRKAPSKEAEIIDIVRKGMRLTAFEQVSNWTKVRFDGHDGYIMSEFLKEI